MALQRDYDPGKPSDVRQFAQEIARLNSSGPAGAIQAERMLKETAMSENGRELVRKARSHAKILAESQKVDLRKVSINTASPSLKASKQVGAQAFTAGQDVFFGQGEYSPSAQRGVELMAHELTHVVQQSEMKKGG